MTDCTGIAASWCPVHGDCTCPRDGDGVIEWHFEAGYTATPLDEMNERMWSGQVYDLVGLLHYKRYHTYRSKHSAAGYPDETLVRERVVWLELKTHAKASRCSAAQKEWIRALLAGGGEVYVVRPRDYDDLAAVLRARDRVFTGPAWDAHERLVARTRAEVGE